MEAEVGMKSGPALRFGSRLVIGGTERACLTAVLKDASGKHFGLTALHALRGKSRAKVTAGGAPIGEAREVPALAGLDLALIHLERPFRWRRELPGLGPVYRLRPPSKLEFERRLSAFLVRGGKAERVTLLAAAHPSRPWTAAYSLAPTKQAFGDSGAPLIHPQTCALLGAHLGGDTTTLHGVEAWYPGMLPLRSYLFKPPLFVASSTELKP